MHSKGSRLSLRFFVLPATPLPFFRNSILSNTQTKFALRYSHYSVKGKALTDCLFVCYLLFF